MFLETDEFENWIGVAQRYTFKPGERLLRPDELIDNIFLVVDGNVRLIGFNQNNEQISLGLRGPGQLLGWVSLMRAIPTEYVQASTEVVAIGFSAKLFVSYLFSNSRFANYFYSLTSLHESYVVAQAAYENSASPSINWDSNFNEYINTTLVYSIFPGEPLSKLPSIPNNFSWYLSTPNLPGIPIGSNINQTLLTLPPIKGLKLPYRLLAMPQTSSILISTHGSKLNEIITSKSSVSSIDLHQLGILESDSITDEMRFPVIFGKGPLQEALAICEMLALHQNVPFRRDAIQKVLEDQFRRDKSLSIELIGGLCELLGLTSQIAEIPKEYISSIELPVVFFLDNIPVILFQLRMGNFVYAHPHKGLKSLPLDSLQSHLSDSLRFLIPRRISSAPLSRFGLNWFTPLLKKYRSPLLLVFIASLLAQLFALAIPLLLQQIIDKVLTQGNLSSLNVLGAAMIIMALFQGILQALRTYILVDTTDRMDLTLGSVVIDRLLSLPLSYFERRSVGDLSQRLGELNTIRSFLTGTALVSALNIIFAFIYLAVMLLYSPLLTAVALSTFPLYILLVFSVSPIYKSLIRKRAVAQSRTQSHLIEVIGGIQTVKAQHFELTARWKWQDRYRNFVSEGFKSVALGSTSSEIGNFLNQLSGLLVLWIGMWLVLKGEFTLGQLIAFRIISSNVTGPLLQLSGLYQGFQGVQLSMERLSDVIDQEPELNKPSDIHQISLPSIIGDVRFENIYFRFASKGPYNLEDISIQVSSGSFVGIVGQSGSGKSTLMKLVSQLYSPHKGRIYIDNYDVSKVDLQSLRRQIGIVPQDSLLFEGTVSENIALNDPNATTEAIIESARISCAHEFIMGLEHGYATPLAERGSNISGGQRQRIAIARTILSSPQLLIMDEATSALDFDSETRLCRNLQCWAKGKTVFFITHRLSSIRTSDLILVMHEGRLVEQGTHTELLSLNGRYSTLYKQQDSDR